MSDYPAVTLRPGETSTISLKLQNYDMAPERLALSVSGVPAGWTATLMGGGQPVAAAMPATNASVSLELRLDVPKNAADRHTDAHCLRRRRIDQLSLPIAVTLAKDLPAKLTLTPQLPELRGTSKSSFEYQLAHQERQRQEADGESRRRRRRRISMPRSPSNMAARNSTRCRSTPARPRT